MTEDFDAFVHGRGHALLRFAYVLCGDFHLAEDLVQEVLARCHRRWGRIEAMDAPEAYVRRALVREFLSWRRRLSSTERVGDVGADWHAAAAVPDPAHDLVVRDEMWTLLATLPRSQRAVLVLRFYADLTDQEIAATLGCSHASVRAQASRALAKLRTAVAPAPVAVPRQRSGATTEVQRGR